MRDAQGLADLLVGYSAAISLRTSSPLGVRSLIMPPDEWDNDVLALLVREATTVFINGELNTALLVLTTV